MGCAALLALGLATRSAYAPHLVGPDLVLLTSGPIPADGVIVIGAVDGTIPSVDVIQVLVTGSDGEVSGTLELLATAVVWRPNESLPPGEYTVEAGCMRSEDCGFLDLATVVVTDAAAFQPVEVSCEVELGPSLGEGREFACCERVITPLAPQHCFAVTADANHVGLASITCESNLEESDLGNVLYRVVEEPAPEIPLHLQTSLVVAARPEPFASLPETSFTLVDNGEPSPLERAEQYCVALEVLDTRDGRLTSTRSCTPDPDLESSERELTDFGVPQLGLTAGCDRPPEAFSETWCDVNRSYYSEQCYVELSFDIDWPRRCELYEEQCPTPTDGGHDPGCECSVGRASGRTRGSFVGTLLGITALLARRSRRAKRRPA